MKKNTFTWALVALMAASSIENIMAPRRGADGEPVADVEIADVLETAPASAVFKGKYRLAPDMKRVDLYHVPQAPHGRGCCPDHLTRHLFFYGQESSRLCTTTNTFQRGGKCGYVLVSVPEDKLPCVTYAHNENVVVKTQQSDGSWKANTASAKYSSDFLNARIDESTYTLQCEFMDYREPTIEGAIEAAKKS